MLLGLSISSASSSSVDDDVQYWMKEFDTDHDNEIDFEDFCLVLQKCGPSSRTLQRLDLRLLV